jgi:hypothetical protein
LAVRKRLGLALFGLAICPTREGREAALSDGVMTASERLVGIDGKRRVGFVRHPLLPIAFLQRERVVFPNSLAEIVQDLEDGLGLLGCPVSRDEKRQPPL